MPEMPHDELRNAAHAIVARLQSDFEAHLNRLEELHNEAREEVRRQTEARAAGEWNAKLDAERAEWQRQLEAAIREARAEADRSAAALAEVRAEAERTTKALADTRAEAERIAATLGAAQAEVERHANAAAEAQAEAERRAMAQAEADRRAAAAVAEIQAEIDRRDAAVKEAHAAADRRVAEETTRLRAELEQAAALSAQRIREEMEQRAVESAASVRRDMEAVAAESADRIKLEMERGLAAERDRAGNELNTERARLHAEITSERERTAAAIDAERQKVQSLTTSLEELRLALTVAETESRSARNVQEELRATLLAEREAARTAPVAPPVPDEDALTNARAAERQSHLAFVERLLTAVRGIGGSRSLSDTLTALTSAAASLAPRVALFIVNERADTPGGREFQGWRATGFGDRSPASLRLTADTGGLIAAAAALRRHVSTVNSAAPSFAELPRDRAALGVPIVVGGKSVAVLYADDMSTQESETPASWPEAMQILGAYASAWLTQITAVRTAQAMRATGGGARPANGSDDDGSARRYARLLVSEIKLYNEAAVRSGREKRDLLQRLGPEIERARRLYEERVSPSGARASYFHEELVHTLADGDATLLGSA
jgi:hypothetical protein